MNIDTEKGIIEAKSYHENYIKEASGAKCNTVRIVNEDEASMLRSLEASIMDKNEAVTIVLKDVATKESVRRQVTDITLTAAGFGREYAIISWRHVLMDETP